MVVYPHIRKGAPIPSHPGLRILYHLTNEFKLSFSFNTLSFIIDNKIGN